MSKILPICDPPITTYQRLAFPLSIAMTVPGADKWFYSNYIQMLCANRKHYEQRHPGEYTLHLDFYAPTLDRLDPLEYVTIDAHEQFFLFFDFRFIRAIIDHGYYIYTDADMYYFPGTPYYNRLHFNHDLLINGYDDDGNIHFYAYGDFKLQQKVMTFEEFRAGYFSENCDNIHYRTRAILYRPIKKEFSIDLSQIKWYMRDYLEGVETFAREHSTVFHPDTLSAVGINIYDEFLQLCDDLRDADEIRIRRHDTFCLYEHKKVMADRIRFLVDQGAAHADTELIARFGELEKTAQQILMLSLKVNALQNSRKDQIEILHRIKGNLEQLRSDEISAWSDFLRINKNPETGISDRVTLQELSDLRQIPVNHVNWDEFYYHPAESPCSKHFLAILDSKPIGLAVLYNIDEKNASAGLEFVPFEYEISDNDFASVIDSVLMYGFDGLALNKIHVNIVRDNYPMFDRFHRSNFVFEAIHRDQFVDSVGVLHDTVVFSMIKSEWVQNSFFAISI